MMRISGECKHTLKGHTLKGLTLKGHTLEGLTLKGHTLEGLTLKGHTLKGHTLKGHIFVCRVWDMQSGECKHTLKGHSGDVYSVAVTSDGQTAVSASTDTTVR